LVLKNNKITSEGSVFVSDLIKFSKTLKELDLSFNELKSVGVKNICNVIINSANHSLEQLYLNGNKCNDYCSEDIFSVYSYSNGNMNKIISFKVTYSSEEILNTLYEEFLEDLPKENRIKYLYHHALCL
jgi:Ran GTPase-activating protein (RanGAP) involved in mRNA processing and transport